MRINFLYQPRPDLPRVCLLQARRNGAVSVAVAAFTILAAPTFAQVPANNKPVKRAPSRVVETDIARPTAATNALPLSAINAQKWGDSSVRQGAMSAASVGYAKAALAAPADPMIRLALGVTLAEQGRTEDATVQFRKALSLADDDVIAALLLQNALAERGDGAEAQDIYQETYRRFAKNDKGAKGGLDASTSIARLRTATQKFPDSPIYFLLLGDAYQLSESWQEADTAYASAIRLAPHWVKPRVNLGLSRLAQGKADDAIRTFEQTLSLDPKNVQAQLWKGDALLRSGQSRKAIAAFQEVAKVPHVTNRVATQALTGMGRAYANTQQDSAALSQYQTAQKLSPTDPMPTTLIGEMQLRNGDYNAAASSYDTALRITRDGGLFAQRPVLYRSLAEALLSAGQVARAKTVLNQALAEEPKQSSLWFRLLAHTAMKQGEPDMARTYLRSALDTDTGPYPLETLRAIDAQALLPALKAEYEKERDLSVSGVHQEASAESIAITMRPATGKGTTEYVRAIVALAHIARYQSETKEEIRLRRELTTLRTNAWDWFLLAEVFDQRQIEPASARGAYLRALEIYRKQGGLSEPAVRWARKRNMALTAPIFVPK